MEVTKTQRNELLLDFRSADARKLAKAVIQHAEDSHTDLLNLAYLLNEAGYDAQNDFRQPPDPWDEPSGERVNET